MSDRGLVSLVGIFSGALLGFGLGVAYEKRARFVAEDKERTRRVEEALAKVGKKEEKKESSQKEASAQDPLKAEKEQLSSDLAEEDYYNYSDPEPDKKYDKSEDFDRISVTFPGDPDYPKDRLPIDDLPDSEEDDDDDSDNRPSVEDLEEMYLESKKPHQIEPGEFELNECGYDQETWTYFQPDNVIVNFWNQRIKEPDEFFGNTEEALHILRNEHDDYSVYWRCPLHRIEIELVVDKTPYEESVAGFRERKQQEIAERRLGNGNTG